MAQIIVNGRRVIDGKVSVSRTLDKSGEEPRLIIQGYLMTKEYIEEIYMIETDRFATANGRDRRIGYIAQLGDQHFIPRLHQYPEFKIDRFAATDGHDQLMRRIVLKSKLVVQLGCNRFSQFRQSGIVRV